MPNSRDTAAATFAVQPWSRPARSPQGSMAPSRIDRSRLGTIRSGSISEARAEAVAVDAHAERAVERERLRRQLGQPDAAVGAGARLAVGALARLALDGDDHRAAARLHAPPRPSPSGARARRRRCVTRSITISMVCFFFLSSAVTSSRRWMRPLMRTRDEAGLARLLEHLAELALAVLGLARHQRRACVLAGSVSSSSTISAAERAVTSPPHRWQRCSPARAYSTRR